MRVARPSGGRCRMRTMAMPLAAALAMIEAGAERIGTSAGVTIVEELKAQQA